MKHKHNAGFTLIEVLVAITLLGIIVVPTCSGLLLSIRMNAKTEELMQSQLAVSSAVETLMAEGITGESGTYDKAGETDRFPEVKVETKKVDDANYYTVTVASNDGLVSVATTIRENTGGGATESVGDDA